MLNFKTKVLIADDDPTTRAFILILLKEIGFEYIEDVKDGCQALQILQKNNDFGLVLSDWNMPVMDGFDLLKKVRGDQNL